MIAGFLTSIDLVSTPEPGMLAVFGAMAIAGMTRRHTTRLRRGLAGLATAFPFAVRRRAGI